MIYYQKGVCYMNADIINLYKLPNINKYEDVHLLTLSENCAVLEDQVYRICHTLPDKQRHIIEAYINARNDLETETFKVALRWGNIHYKSCCKKQSE